METLCEMKHGTELSHRLIFYLLSENNIVIVHSVILNDLKQSSVQWPAHQISCRESEDDVNNSQ